MIAPATTILGQPLPTRLAGTAHCPRCDTDVELHATANAWDRDGRVTGWGPAYGLCCELFLVVSPDGIPRVEDLSGDHAQAPLEVA